MKPQLVPENRESLISDLSPDEEARALNLADAALQNSPSTNNLLEAGDRARADHMRLMEEVREAEESLHRKDAA